MPATALDLPVALLDPVAYPSRPDSVALRETHISWVFLAGDRAYKVKKPLLLPFVDYSSPERRRWCCEEEVRLNRRLAPGTYLGVVGIAPVPAGGARVTTADAADAVEHAVEMRRYDEADTLARHLAAGTATTLDLELVGRRIARFHHACERYPVGGGAALEAVLDETLASLAASDVLAPPRMAALRRFTAAALLALHAELAARDARSLVRDGHGDLRAEHVLLDAGLSVVDTVEFDPALRIADVAYDLAFLVMDLRRADEGLVAPLLRGYRDAGGDHGSRRLLAFLTAVRALVRAKVDLLRAAQIGGADADERRARGLGLVALAERLAWEVRLPPVVCVAGLSASGKSTIAAELSRITGRPVLSSDVVRKRLAGVPVDRPAEAGAYAPGVSAAVYRELGTDAGRCAAAGTGVLVDATFRRGAEVAAFRAACTQETGWLECHAPDEVLLERARRRGGVPEHGSDAGVAVVRRQLAESTGRLPLPEPPLAQVATTAPLPALMAALAAGLDARLRR